MTTCFCTFHAEVTRYNSYKAVSNVKVTVTYTLLEAACNGYRYRNGQ